MGLVGCSVGRGVGLVGKGDGLCEGDGVVGTTWVGELGGLFV